MEAIGAKPASNVFKICIWTIIIRLVASQPVGLPAYASPHIHLELPPPVTFIPFKFRYFIDFIVHFPKMVKYLT